MRIYYEEDRKEEKEEFIKIINCYTNKFMNGEINYMCLSDNCEGVIYLTVYYNKKK